MEARALVRELAVVGGKQEPCLSHISLVHAKAHQGEKSSTWASTLLLSNSSSPLCAWTCASLGALAARMSAGGERESDARIALRRKGARMKHESASRLTRPLPLAGGGGEGCEVVGRGGAHGVHDGGDDRLG